MIDLSNTTARWLGLDPSLRAFGWTVFQQRKGERAFIVDAGLFMTSRDNDEEKRRVDNETRILFLAQSLEDLILRAQPIAIGVEAVAIPWGKSSGFTVAVLGRVRGLVDMASIVHSIGQYEYDAQALKKFFTGDRNAEKELVGRRLLTMYPELAKFLPPGPTKQAKTDGENITDAAAVGHMVAQSDAVKWVLSNVA